MKRILKAACIAAVAAVPSIASAACDAGEIVVKFSHVTNTDKHPKGIAATLLQDRVNEEMNGKACMEVCLKLGVYLVTPFRKMRNGIPYARPPSARARPPAHSGVLVHTKL